MTSLFTMARPTPEGSIPNPAVSGEGQLMPASWNPPAPASMLEGELAPPQCHDDLHYIRKCGHWIRDTNGCSSECYRPAGFGAKFRKIKCKFCKTYKAEEFLVVLLLYADAQKRFYESMESLEGGDHAEECLEKLNDWLETKVRLKVPKSIWLRYRKQGSSQFQASVLQRIARDKEIKAELKREIARRAREEDEAEEREWQARNEWYAAIDWQAADDAMYYAEAMGDEGDYSDYESFESFNSGGYLPTSPTGYDHLEYHDRTPPSSRDEEYDPDYTSFMESELSNVRQRLGALHEAISEERGRQRQMDEETSSLAEVDEESEADCSAPAMAETADDFGPSPASPHEEQGDSILSSVTAAAIDVAETAINATTGLLQAPCLFAPDANSELAWTAIFDPATQPPILRPWERNGIPQYTRLPSNLVPQENTSAALINYCNAQFEAAISLLQRTRWEAVRTGEGVRTVMPLEREEEDMLGASGGNSSRSASERRFAEARREAEEAEWVEELVMGHDEFAAQGWGDYVPLEPSREDEATMEE